MSGTLCTPFVEELRNGLAYTYAAAPFEYRTVCSNGQGLILFKDDSITLMSPEGDIQKIWTVAEMGIEQSEFDEMLTMLSWGEGYIGYRRGNYMPLGWVPGSYTHLRVFDLVAGAISEMSTEEWDALAVFADHSIWTQEHAVPNSQPVTDSLLGPEAPYLLSCHEYADTGTIITYYRQDGTPLPQLTTNTAYWYQQVNLLGGLIEVLDLNIASYYDLETMECVFRTYLGYESD